MCTVLLFLILYVSVTTHGYFYIEEGEFCRKENGQIGTCTHFNKCISAILEVRRNGRPQICSFVGIYPIVCCTTVLDNSIQDLEEYLKQEERRRYNSFTRRGRKDNNWPNS